MILKEYQIKVIDKLKDFFNEAEKQKSKIEKIKQIDADLNISYVDATYKALELNFADRPENGLRESYPRFCLKVPTAGGKTLLAVETIREYQNIFAKKRTGLVVWITHRESIYRQTIENLRDKNHIYRQWLDQSSGNKTIILEKGQTLRKQDIENNLVILMLMIQSANRETKENMKMFQDSGGYEEFFPPENQYEKHKKLFEKIPNLDFIEDTLFNKKLVKTSLGNAIRVLNPLVIVDEFHTMFSDKAKQTLDGLNPSMIIGLSATPKERAQMNVLVEIFGQELKREDMIKLDLHLHSPTISGNWHEMINDIINKREYLEDKATKLGKNEGVYIRPIALIQAERTGKEQRGKGFVHSEDVREYLIEKGVSAYEIAVKSSDMDEIKEEKLLSKSSEIRYIITKEALKEGWDCSFAYILGIIPNAKSETSMTQLVGRILRQPYAKKTGIKELDESYVYFTKGQIADVLNNIKNGFKEEGLGDLIKGISPESGPTGSRKIKAKIKDNIFKKYPESLYLPAWMIKEGKTYRKFSYDIDIKPKIDWSKLEYKKWLKNDIIPALSKKKDTYELIVDLDSHKRVDIENGFNAILEIPYIARRATEIIDNAFIAYELAEKFILECKKHKDDEIIKANSGLITQEFIKKLIEEKENQENNIFNLLVKNKDLILGVTSDDNIGYMLPKEIEVYPEGLETYALNLFDKSDILSMNPLEKKVASLIDEKENVLWWVRNMSEKKNWYGIQGWKRNKIRPDFIIAKKDNTNSLELVYVLESKGEHLIDNPDTTYKKLVFDKMNKNKVEKVNLSLAKFKLNDEFRFELVEQGTEELLINTFLK